MGKVKRQKKQKGIKVESYGSDDERSYANEKVPDSRENDFYHDEIDEFHQQNEKILLEAGAKIYESNADSEEEEVLGVASDSDDDEVEEYERRLRKFQSKGFKDELASDVEEEEQKGLPDDRAWGSERNKFYGADVSDDDLMGGDGSDVDAAALEEKEALAIQKKMVEQLDDQDFALDIFKSVEKPKKGVTIPAQEEKVQQDLSQLTRKEKLDLVRKESPELLELVEDYKVKMTELKDVFLPVQNLLRTGTLPKSDGAQYINTKVALYLNYCVNISFYMMLKAKRTPVENHPVIKRIVQYRNLIKQLEAVDGKILPEVQMILEKVKNGEDLEVQSLSDDGVIQGKKRKSTSKRGKKGASEKKLSELLSGEESDDLLTERQKTKKRKKLEVAEGRYKTKGEQEALEYYEMMKAGRLGQNIDTDEEEEEASGIEDGVELGTRIDTVEETLNEEDEDINEEETDGKRAITYQIAKNKGLMPKRKKEQRNPRVKHKLKFRKAKIRRKGQVREVRTEMHKYGGELSGIRAGVKRSIKLK